MTNINYDDFYLDCMSKRNILVSNIIEKVHLLYTFHSKASVIQKNFIRRI